jgi:hypothetical protein
MRLCLVLGAALVLATAAVEAAEGPPLPQNYEELDKKVITCDSFEIAYTFEEGITYDPRRGHVNALYTITEFRVVPREHGRDAEPKHESIAYFIGRMQGRDADVSVSAIINDEWETLDVLEVGRCRQTSSSTMLSSNVVRPPTWRSACFARGHL